VIDGDLYVIGIDPGVTTGLAQVVFYGTGYAALQDSGECDFEASVHWLRRALAATRGSNRAMVTEKFIITHRTATINAPGDSLEMIGVSRLLAYDEGMKLARQAPSEAKALVSNEMLREIGVWSKGTKGHSIDAMRHATLYAVRQGWVPASMRSASDLD
jgi:hypothetical protein